MKHDFINIIDKIKFKTDKKDESFKNIVELSGLEYAIHFTFHHTFTLFEIQKTNEKRRYIIDKMISASNNIWEIYSEYINENERLKLILEHIEILIEIINKNYYDYYMFYIGIEYCNYLISGFNHCKIIFKRPRNIIKGFNNDIPYESSSSEEEEQQNIDKEIIDEKYKLSEEMAKVLESSSEEEKEEEEKELMK